jgi:hypothetical protein
MLSSKANIHHSKLPELGEIVIVKMRELKPSRRYRKFIVESFPLSDSADQRYSRGIHTVNLKALDTGDRFRVSGFYCESIA